MRLYAIVGMCGLLLAVCGEEVEPPVVGGTHPLVQHRHNVLQRATETRSQPRVIDMCRA